MYSGHEQLSLKRKGMLMHIHTFRKFVSDNIILFGMTVTFFSKTCRLSFILLKKMTRVSQVSYAKENSELCDKHQT